MPKLRGLLKSTAVVNNSSLTGTGQLKGEEEGYWKCIVYFEDQLATVEITIRVSLEVIPPLTTHDQLEKTKRTRTEPQTPGEYIYNGINRLPAS